MQKKSIVILFIGLAMLMLAAVQPAQAKAAKFDSAAFGGFKARAIGPAVMSGRITAIDVDLNDTHTMFVGTAGGGVWKTVNGGVTFQQVFEKYTMAIGSLTIDQKDTQTVWVGTGECNVRNSVSVGTGLYLTKDGGKNWKFMGFKDSERIAKIIIHPEDSKIVYVAVMGHLWNANEERGLYKTTDEGKTWKKVLHVDNNTGCSDVDIDPQEPDVLYASMWQYRRYPHLFTSGGKGSALYKTTDGGKKWKKLVKDLPKGKLGRIAVAIAPSRPGTIYATVEAEESALYRSDDMGENWKKLSTALNVTTRPFYFSELQVDPQAHKCVYSAGLNVTVSINGGQSFTNPGGSYHGDVHTVWINPKDSNHLIIGTDGGVYISHNKGRHYSHVKCLPVSQFYNVSYDMKTPYNVYGGLQDNGQWYGPSKGIGSGMFSGGIENHQWTSVGIGDGYKVLRHPLDEDIVYWEWQEGNIARRNERTHESKDIKPLPSEKNEPEYRYNWNGPLTLSPNDPETLYMGAQFLFKSTNRGDTWEKISPDLTTNNPEKYNPPKPGGLSIDDTGAESHCTLFVISESPKDKNVIWAGTDDGNIQVTRDGGKNWQNQVKNIPGLPPYTWCSYIETGRHETGTAYATFDGHRTGDMKPYVYKTTDYGKTWTSLATDAISGHCHVLREDTVNKNLLFLGTEMGLFVTIDGGKEWAHLTEALPKVSIRDMAIHPREHDLIIATHGLGIQILDDITPLRTLTTQVLSAYAAVLPSRPATMDIAGFTMRFSDDTGFFGETPQGGAGITYYLKKRHIFGDLKLEILDRNGKVMKTIPTSKRRGLNRIFWDMRIKPPKASGLGSIALFYSLFGPMVDEGTYTVRLVKGKKEYTGTVKLEADKVSGHSKEDRKLRQETVMKLYRVQERLAYTCETSSGLLKQIDKKLKTAKSKKIKNKLSTFKKELETFFNSIAQNKGVFAGNKLRENVIILYGTVSGFGGKPSDSQLYYLSVLKAKVENAEKTFNRLLSQKLKAVNTLLASKKQATLKVLTKEEYKKKK
ncbi:MAG: hypothetical protein GY757_30420 [bacterium]|nr:hypothetical protein [bacterium]